MVIANAKGRCRAMECNTIASKSFSDFNADLRQHLVKIEHANRPVNRHIKMALQFGIRLDGYTGLTRATQIHRDTVHGTVVDGIQNTLT